MTIMQVHAELILEVPVEHGLLLENLLDLAHAPFTHTSTFAPLQTSARQKWKRPLIVRKDALNCLVIGPLCEQMPARITRKSFSSLKKGSRCILCSRGTV
jgi:phenylpropionate dioxygenase-like ring-hydroxylating dioxygenase large terminal subunit